MSTREAAALTVRRRVRRRRRADLAGHVVLAGSALAWITLVLLSLPVGPAGPPAHQHGSSELTAGGADAAASVSAVSLGWVTGWLLMTAAMMWPLVVPIVNRVAQAAFPRWRSLLTSIMVLATTALWLALGFAAALVAQAASVPVGSVWWQLAFLGVAAVAWRSARRSRLLSRCAKLPPVAPGGIRGVRSAARVGVVAWKRCALLCGPLMIAMVVGHNPVVLVAASLSVWWEAWHPRARRDRLPLALIVVAGLGAIGGGVLAS